MLADSSVHDPVGIISETNDLPEIGFMVVSEIPLTEIVHKPYIHCMDVSSSWKLSLVEWF